jgi:2-dehydro-3-deoxyphosphogluconate aldolase/(4S)-4-hydroxy-2-oxoglutarate aldolase
MSSFSRLEVLNAMVETGLIPVFYHRDVEVAKKVVAACAAGGARTVEFTNRGDFAPQVFNELAQHVAKTNPKVMLAPDRSLTHPPQPYTLPAEPPLW